MDRKIKKAIEKADFMKRFYSEIRAGIFGVFNPLENFTRTGPLLWIFLGAIVFLVIGLSLSLSLFSWTGGFIVALFVAVALALFENL